MAGKSLGILTLDLIARVGAFEQGMDKAERSAKKSAKGIKDSADQASAAWTGLGKIAAGALAGLSVGTVFSTVINNTRQMEQEQAQLAAVLKSTGEAAGFSRDQLNAMAASLSSKSTFSTNEINQAQIALTAFSGIVGNEFVRAQQAAADMATRTGMSISQAAETIGRALDVPSKGMAALSRQGFRFTDEQKELVKQLESTGRAAEAQGIILESLEGTYEGAAQAARDTFGGALDALQNTIGGLLTGNEGSLSAATAAVNILNDALSSPLAAKALNALAASAAVVATVLTVQLAKAAILSAASFATAEVAAARYQIALARTTAASRTASAALMGQSVAARSAAAAMALLGGPAGLALIAASALVYFGTRASETRDEAEGLRQEVDYLNASFDGFTKNQAAAALQGIQEQFLTAQLRAIDAGDAVSRYERLLRDYPSDSRVQEWNRALIAARGEFDTAGQAVTELTNRIDQLNAIVARSNVESAAQAASKTYTDLAARINEQILLHGLNTDAARLEARINAGLVTGLLEGEAARLIALQKSRDAQLAEAAAQKKKEDAVKSASFEAKKAAEEATRRAVASLEAIESELTALERAAKVWGMSADEVRVYDLRVKGATESQIEYAQSLLDTVSGFEKQKKAMEAVATLDKSLAASRSSERRQYGDELAGIGLSDKAQERLRSQRQLIADYQDQINQAAQMRASGDIDDDTYQKQLELYKDHLDQRIGMQQQYYSALDAMEGNWQAGASKGLQNYAEQARDIYGQTADLIQGTMESLSGGVADSLTGAIMHGEDLRESMAALGMTITESVLNSLIEMGVQYGINAALEAAGITAVSAVKVGATATETAAELAATTTVAGAEVAAAGTVAAAQIAAIGATTTASLAATATTTSAQVSAGAATTAAWTPAAIVSSIGSFGTAAAIGLAAVVAALAFGKGFRSGGYTGSGGVDDVAGVVHGQEFVFDAAATSRIGVGNLEAIRSGKLNSTLERVQLDMADQRGSRSTSRGNVTVHQTNNYKGAGDNRTDAQANSALSRKMRTTQARLGR